MQLLQEPQKRRKTRQRRERPLSERKTAAAPADHLQLRQRREHPHYLERYSVAAPRGGN